ncbi:efflux RND transporter periplasmic adaptor subunit [Chitinispirillales bacterium ANBcel5]|uniref:efflux RND transporter periplasmic adaptor subunit n=1 Tax=Cellulosispirillum alkaliphilum TaxID=3039283 RepID=UPI002A50E671|nr:efflux RND transporter periplasmic adaptor subunit [Chitinispirillales bacterium ANBcel5]
MMNRNKVLLLVFIVGIVILVVWMGYFRNDGIAQSGGSGWGGMMSGPVAVRTVQPETRSLRGVREFTGNVRASYTYVISADVSGRLISVNKRIGDYVNRAEMLGRIDDTEYRHALQEMNAQVKVSRASLKEAEAQLSFTEREVERVRGLVEKGISSQVELENLETQLTSNRSRLELANAQLEQRKASLAQARTRLGYTEIRAAQPGFIAERHADGGAQLSVGAPVFTVVGIDTVYVEIAATERDYHQLKPGRRAEVTVDALPGRVFEGEVSRVAPLFQTSSRTATVEVAVPNDSLLLKPGMFARLAVTMEQNDSALSVPATALVETNDSKFVYTVTESSTAERVPVETGLKDGEWVEIISPAQLSVPVVTLGSHLLRDGAQVVTENQKSESREGWEANGE